MGTALDKYADREPQWDHPVVIESHINGVRSREMHPNTPITYDEIAEDASAAGRPVPGRSTRTTRASTCWARTPTRTTCARGRILYDPARNPTNLELLQQAQEIAKDVGRPIATHEEARALYQLS